MIRCDVFIWVVRINNNLPAITSHLLTIFGSLTPESAALLQSFFCPCGFVLVTSIPASFTSPLHWWGLLLRLQGGVWPGRVKTAAWKGKNTSEIQTRDRGFQIHTLLNACVQQIKVVPLHLLPHVLGAVNTGNAAEVTSLSDCEAWALREGYRRVHWLSLGCVHSI